MLSNLIEIFLTAPSTQLSPKIVEAAKGWASRPPTVDQCDQVLQMMNQHHASRTARNVLHAIRLEAEAGSQVVFDNHHFRPLS